MTPMGRTDAVVIGLGNPLMSDDGIGLAAMELLRSRWELPEGVELVDGGTWGLRLLPAIEDADRVLLLDAVDVDAPAGTVVVMERDRLPRFLSSKLSPHQVGVRDLLALAELRGSLPAETVAMGIQPGRVEMGASLGPDAEASLEELVERAVERLAAWGFPLRPRDGRPPDQPDPALRRPAPRADPAAGTEARGTGGESRA